MIRGVKMAPEDNRGDVGMASPFVVWAFLV